MHVSSTHVQRMKDGVIAVSTLDPNAASLSTNGDTLVFSGHARTGERGFVRYELPSVPGIERAKSPLIVLVTPTDSGPTDAVPQPHYCVVRTRATSIAIWSFTCDGELAPGVDVSWQCLAILS